MKALFLSALFLASTAFATNTPIKSNDVSVGLLTAGKIKKVSTIRPMCRPNQRCRTITHASIELMVEGCLNRVGPVTASVELNERERTYEISLTATQIVNAKSRGAFCGPESLKRVIEVQLPDGATKENTILKFATELYTGNEIEEETTPAPRACRENHAPVCGMPKRRCPPGRICTAVMPSPKTYSNECHMKNAGATFLYKGECRQTR